MPGRITVRQRWAFWKWKTEADFAHLRGDGDGAGNHVEQHVPLRAQQHQNDGPHAQPAAHPHQCQQHHWEKRWRGTEAAICASGCATRASRGLNPMATPAGTAHSEEW